MNCDCDDKKCEFDTINEDDDEYFIERLQDIIKICEFLIQVTEHKKMKKDTCDTILKDLKKEQEKEEESSEEDVKDLFEEILKQINDRPYKDTSIYPYTIRNPYRNRWWEVWF